MTIINLPQDIFPGENMPPGDIRFYDYTATAGALKGKCILQKNAISLVITGQKKIHFAEKTVDVNDSEFHFLSSGNCLASMDLSQQTIFRSVMIFFDDKTLVDFYVKYDNLVSKYAKKAALREESYISIKKDDFIGYYISSLLVLLKGGQSITQQMRQLKFEELMLYLLQQHPLRILAFQKPKANQSDNLEIRKAVENNIMSNLTVEELAFLCNLSVSTFKRRFAKIYGSSPNKWLLQRRMDIAANLLANHQERPGDIFQKLGYENHSSFTQSFKQVFGVTPRDYRLQKLNV